MMKKQVDNKDIDYKFVIQRILGTLLGNRISNDDKELVFDALEKELTERPFRVAVIGQGGVGKSTTLNAVFGLQNYTASIKEGTREIEEKIFPIRDGFSLAVYDMPGLNNDVDKDIIYEEMYRQILPGCDVIVYVVNAHSHDIGEDCRILKDIVLPICKNKEIMKNLVLAINKIDTIGESENPNDPELQWDIIENKPTAKLSDLIEKKLHDITVALVREKIVDKENSLSPDQIVIYSAIYNFNLRDFLLAITKTKRGWVWTSTVGFENLGKWSDKRYNLK